jgi:hypothetical protein
MAAFCTKCGNSLPSTTGFCPSCGTPIAAGPVAAPSPLSPNTPQPPAAYAPPAGYPAQQPRSSGGALKIVLIVIAVIVGLGVLAAGSIGFMAWRVSRSIHTDSNGNATLSALGANISAGKNVNISEANLGVPIYPNATRGEGGMHMTLPNMSMVSAIFLTDDPQSTVADFYKGKLGPNEADTESARGAVLSSGRDGPNGKNGTVITIGPGSGNNSGKTQISIVRTTSTQ